EKDLSRWIEIVWRSAQRMEHREISADQFTFARTFPIESRWDLRSDLERSTEQHVAQTFLAFHRFRADVERHLCVQRSDPELVERVVQHRDVAETDQPFRIFFQP